MAGQQEATNGCVLWAALLFFCLLPGLGVPLRIHAKLKDLRKDEVYRLLEEARQERLRRIAMQVADEKAEADEVQGKLDRTKNAILKAEQSANAWRHRNKKPLAELKSLTEEGSPRAAELMSNSSLDLEGVVRGIARDALGSLPGFKRFDLTRGPTGFELTLQLNANLSWSDKTKVMAGIKRLQLSLEPRWISRFSFSKLRAKPVSVGPLDKLTKSRLEAFVASYYGTAGGRLPDPGIVERRTHADAAWGIENGTQYSISIQWYGAGNGSLVLGQGKTREVRFKPGTYYVTVKTTTAARVRPYSGSFTFKGGYLYGSRWVIKTSFGGVNIPTMPRIPTFPRRKRR